MVPVVVATHCTVLRAELLGAVRKLQPRVIAMEACSSVHHWGRQFLAMDVGLT
jgi:transposase